MILRQVVDITIPGDLIESVIVDFPLNVFMLDIDCKSFNKQLHPISRQLAKVHQIFRSTYTIINILLKYIDYIILHKQNEWT